MAKLIYAALVSLDGYVADRDGKFDWAEPDEEVHTFINDLSRPIGTFLYGRRLYEVMVAWETLGLDDQDPPIMRDFAHIWRAADKIIYSRSLSEASSAKTCIERDFDPDAIRAMKTSVAGDMSVGGPELAGHAFRAGLVDECHLFIVPAIVGGGTPALPSDVRLDLRLVDERCFGNGTVYVRYLTPERLSARGSSFS